MDALPQSNTEGMPLGSARILTPPPPLSPEEEKNRMNTPPCMFLPRRPPVTNTPISIKTTPSEHIISVQLPGFEPGNIHMYLILLFFHL